MVVIATKYAGPSQAAQRPAREADVCSNAMHRLAARSDVEEVNATNNATPNRPAVAPVKAANARSAKAGNAKLRASEDPHQAVINEDLIFLPRKPRRGDLVELDIEALDGRAWGQARQRVSIGPGGAPRTLVYAIRRGIPGDKVEAHVRRVRGGRLEATIETLRESSPSRIDPRCHYFADQIDQPGCGGCALQSLSYDAQLALKAERVASLVRAAGVTDDMIQDAIPARSPWFYRNKMEMSFGVDKEGTYALGMHPQGRRYDVLPLEMCYLQSEESAKIVDAMRTWGQNHGVPHHNQRADTGLLRTLTLREGKRTGQRLIELTTSPAETCLFDGEERAAQEVVSSFLKALMSFATQSAVRIDSVVWTRHIAKKGQRTRLEHEVLYGKDTLQEALHIGSDLPMLFDVHARAFFQPNTLQAEVLYEEVIRATGLRESEGKARVMDLYCGTGTIGLAMARVSREVIGIELSADAIASAWANAKRNEISNITFYEGDVGEVLEREGLAEPGAVDVVVVDPPRAGLLPSALEHLKRLAAPRLVYVSCNPEALAKNLVDLIAAGWAVESVRPVDMFPQTSHIETIAVMQRSTTSSST